jgi:hypothetical protein
MGFRSLTSDPVKIGRGRFQVSEGVAPAEKILPDENLLTLFQDSVGQPGEFFEVVLLQGTIVSTYQKTDGRYVATYCRGLAGCLQYQTIYTTATDAVAYESAGHSAGGGELDLGVTWLPDATSITRRGRKAFRCSCKGRFPPVRVW